MTRGVAGSMQPHGAQSRSRTCPCERCRAGRAAYEKRRRVLGLSRVDGTGTARRLRALAAMGWPSHELAARLGVSREAVQQRTRETWPAERSTVGRVRDLYDALSMTPGPSERARRRAARLEWAPPLAWDDDTIDDPTARPVGVGYTPAPAIDRVTDLEALGLTRAQIADRLGIRQDTVDTLIQRARRTAA